ncbi:LiaF transmembrane domain-containing protein [Alkalithermobacter paradoxus]|uniref:LiaF transmembrane domain-containing protein n=1 Tax=Alkalithermobacter paradoxus TaxID=29349 RepID=A0A1V4I992_9FIRM|nr:hypothetical protein CLOTH_08440 [[Clostridium] thermoalcaliphilum]
MNKNNSSLGIFLVMLGGFLILKNLNIITWSIIPGIFDLWPIVLVIIGINIIFNKNKMINTISWILFFLILVAYGYIQEEKYINMNAMGNESIIIENKLDVENGSLDLKLGAVNLDIDSTESVLVKGYVPKGRVDYNVDFKNDNKRAIVSFEENNNLNMYNRIREKDYMFYINEDILWNIDAKIGAANSKFDLSNLKVKDLNIDSGAGNFKLILGDKLYNNNININMGAGNIEIFTKEDLGLKVDFKGLVKDIELPNSNWEKFDTYYLSPNYNTSQKKVNIDIKMGAGNIKVIEK